MPIIHFLPYEVRHIVPKNLVPEKKAEENKDASKAEKVDADKKSENDKKKKTPSRRRLKDGPPVAKVADVYIGEEDTDISNPALYYCPVYKTSTRAGALSWKTGMVSCGSSHGPTDAWWNVASLLNHLYSTLFPAIRSMTLVIGRTTDISQWGTRSSKYLNALWPEDYTYGSASVFLSLSLAPWRALAPSTCFTS